MNNGDSLLFSSDLEVSSGKRPCPMEVEYLSLLVEVADPTERVLGGQ